ncbi:MAG: peptidase S9 [Nitrosomonas sp.]|nr:MAG: peptidase S9 [Nitrosomonas sp.]
MRLFLATCCLLAGFTSLIAQTSTNVSTLSIEQIMQGEKFVGFLPENISWSEDSQSIYFDWNPDGDTLPSLYKTTIKGGQPELVKEAEMWSRPTGGTVNKDHTYKVYSKNGDIFLLDLKNAKTLQLTNTVEAETDPVFSGDESKIIFEKEDNLYSWNRSDGQLVQLTQFKKKYANRTSSKADFDQWLIDDQLANFEVLQERKAKKETQERRKKQTQPKRPLEIYYGDKRLSNLVISPDMRFVTFRLTTTYSIRGTEVPEYVTESGYVEDTRARRKVGTPQDAYEMGIYDRQLDTVFMIDTKEVEGIYDKPAYLYEYNKDTLPFESQYDKPKEVVIHGPVYNDKGQAVVVVRSLDNKDRWIMLLNPENGKLSLLDWQHDEAWIGGPGISGWNFFLGNIGWMPDNQHIWYQSESTGFSHLYQVDIATGKKRALTNGKFEILEVSISKDQRYFYLTANAEGPDQQHFYRLPIKGGRMEKITTEVGNHEVTLSPDEQYLAVRYSYSNQPWELYLMENKPGAKRKQLTQSTTPEFKAYNWRVPEIIHFRASDGARVPARIYRPAEAKEGDPAVIFVHGAGYLQNVHQWWSSYYREYMFHNFLVDHGYTVLDIDFRASAGYGRDWRTAIYRHMGGKDLEDQIDGAAYLVSEYGIDADRIGIYGGSYGGFISLMALFTSPGTFRCGAALRSVTDWAHYNHDYTSNILNTPVLDSLAYKRSSPIYHAEGLAGQLLILHGMVDTNVQFQDVVRLAQRLIELGKDNWEFAVFPVEGHGFVEPKSWADEYKRIFRLFQTSLKE